MSIGETLKRLARRIKRRRKATELYHDWYGTPARPDYVWDDRETVMELRDHKRSQEALNG